MRRRSREAVGRRTPTADAALPPPAHVGRREPEPGAPPDVPAGCAHRRQPSSHERRRPGDAPRVARRGIGAGRGSGAGGRCGAGEAARSARVGVGRIARRAWCHAGRTRCATRWRDRMEALDAPEGSPCHDPFAWTHRPGTRALALTPGHPRRAAGAGTPMRPLGAGARTARWGARRSAAEPARHDVVTLRRPSRLPQTTPRPAPPAPPRPPPALRLALVSLLPRPSAPHAPSAPARSARPARPADRARQGAGGLARARSAARRSAA